MGDGVLRGDRVSDPQFEAFCPFVGTKDLDATLARLARAVEG